MGDIVLASSLLVFSFFALFLMLWFSLSALLYCCSRLKRVCQAVGNHPPEATPRFFMRCHSSLRRTYDTSSRILTHWHFPCCPRHVPHWRIRLGKEFQIWLLVCSVGTGSRGKGAVFDYEDGVSGDVFWEFCFLVESEYQKLLAALRAKVRKRPTVTNVLTMDLFCLLVDLGHEYLVANCTYWSREVHSVSHMRVRQRVLSR